MAAFASTPSNYEFLKKLRRAKKATLKPCSYLKSTTKLRDYQVIGALHLLSLARMVLGDGVGLGKCLTKDTYLPTTEGFKKLKEFIPQDPKDDTLYPYLGNCRLLTINGPVKPNAVYYCGVREGIKIVTQKGYELIGLGHHPVYVPAIDCFEYKRLDTLSVGDYVCICREGLFSNKYVDIAYGRDSSRSIEYKIPIYLDETLAELLGFYVSEGHCSCKYTMVITQFDPPINNRIRELLRSIFDYNQSEEVFNYKEEITINSLEIVRVFEILGINPEARSGDQIIPYSILSSPISVIRAFLRAYFEGDGGVEISNNIVSCSSKSMMLLKQIQLLLLSFGITSRLKKKMVKVGEGRKPYFILYFCGKDTVLFQEKIGFISERKNELLKQITAKKRNSNLDIIPIGKELLKQSIKDITFYLKSLPEHKGFSIRGSGWKGLVGYHLKRMIEEVIYYKKKLTYELLDSFMQAIDKHNLKEVVSNYSTLKFIQNKNYYFDKIVSIEATEDTFADFHVPEEHNFVGNGFVNHNTLQMITSYAYRLMVEPKLKLLVVTPKSAMQQWKEEFETFCEGISVHVLTNEYGEVRYKDPKTGKMKSTEEYGTIEELKAAGHKCRIISGFEARKAQYKTVKADVLVVNYYAVKEDYVFLIENRGPRYQVCFDEAQEFKNGKTKTWFGANEISDKATYCYGMSATIIKNKLEEAYFIYRVIAPGIFPGKTAFLNEYAVRKKMSLWRKGKKRFFNKVVGYKNLGKFKEIIDPFFLSRKTREVADELPRLISRKLILEMSEEQTQLYRKALSGELYCKLIREKYFKFESYYNSATQPTEKEEKIYEVLRTRYEESLTKEGLEKNKIAALSYCQLVSNGPGWLGEEGESSKETEFKRLFDQELSDEKTIVFTRFKTGIKRLSVILDDLGVKYTQITGDNGIQERNNSRKYFQDLEQDCKVIFITQAGSAAINLQAAGVILYYDTPWSYGDLYQSIGRAQRIGSIREHILLLHMVNQKTIDEHVLDILDGKKNLINEVIGDIAEGAIKFKDDEILFKDEESTIDALYSSVFKKVA